ncbi:MAG: arginine--tRNA ligase [Acidobacteria bacterium]|nr:MAG: arginine--tRNA ligase [Acidobacteriota bacterium]
MHVGHIRSTILGDSLARLLRLLSHRVITDNHIGDWGTQFGMLLLGWKRELDRAALQVDAISELERIYKTIQAEIKQQTKEWLRKHYSAEIYEGLAKGLDEDEVHRRILAELPANRGLNLSATDVASRQELVKLQAGDAENLRIWREMLALSQEQFDAIYGRLGVKFDHRLGESFYNPRLPALVEDLVAKGIARESEGALAVFFEDIPQLKEHPALIRKSDGGFNYTTTDLATLAHRLETWQPDEVIYVTDGRQQLHFQQVFAAFRKWQSHAPPEGRVTRVPDPDGKDLGLSALVPPKKEVKLAHVWFGSILGEDGKPFKTRSGETVKLADLLDEAEERAFNLVTEKSPDLPDLQRREIARVVGLGAVKYADLLPNRQSDYVFSWDKMLALNGNTAPYLQYAYARIRSIFRKAEGTSNIQPVLRSSTAAGEHPTSSIQVSAPEELTLARHLLNFGLVLEAAAEEFRPNFICNYLYDLAGRFSSFYENCPVLKAEANERASRLTLCELTARVLKQGLDALGIEVLDQM